MQVNVWGAYAIAFDKPVLISAPITIYPQSANVNEECLAGEEAHQAGNGTVVNTPWVEGKSDLFVSWSTTMNPFVPEPTVGYKHHFNERVGHLKDKKKQRTHEACPALGARSRLGITLHMPYDACFHHNGTVFVSLPDQDTHVFDATTLTSFDIPRYMRWAFML